MRSMSISVVLWLLPTLASAQSWYVLHATLEADDVDVGELYATRVTPVGWAGERPRVRYEDDVVSMQVDLSLEDERTFVSIGVGRSATVRTDSPLRIEMRPLTWAPLLGRAGDGVRIALPPGLPASRGVLRGAVDAPTGADPPTDAFTHAGPPSSFDPACGTLTLRVRPDRRAASWTVEGDGASIQLGPQRDGFTRAQVYVDGFVVHGWLEGPMAACDGSIRMGGVSSACGDGFAMGIVVTLPAGTELFASATAPRPFARLRAATPGIEPLHHPAAQACANGTCRRVPAEPSGDARWILHGHAEPGSWLLTAWVRTPAESLVRPTEPAGGFGACWSPPDEWPRP